MRASAVSPSTCWRLAPSSVSWYPTSPPSGPRTSSRTPAQSSTWTACFAFTLVFLDRARDIVARQMAGFPLPITSPKGPTFWGMPRLQQVRHYASPRVTGEISDAAEEPRRPCARPSRPGGAGNRQDGDVALVAGREPEVSAGDQDQEPQLPQPEGAGEVQAADDKGGGRRGVTVTTVALVVI